MDDFVDSKMKFNLSQRSFFSPRNLKEKATMNDDFTLPPINGKSRMRQTIDFKSCAAKSEFGRSLKDVLSPSMRSTKK